MERQKYRERERDTVRKRIGIEIEDWHYSATKIIGTKHKLTKGTHHFSLFEFELKFGCLFSFFSCFVVNYNSYVMDKNGRTLESQEAISKGHI